MIENGWMVLSCIAGISCDSPLDNCPGEVLLRRQFGKASTRSLLHGYLKMQ
jgi:hypothetical protein